MIVFLNLNEKEYTYLFITTGRFVIPFVILTLRLDLMLWALLGLDGQCGLALGTQWIFASYMLSARSFYKISLLQLFQSREAPTAFSVMDVVAICCISAVVRIELLIRIAVVQACNENADKMTL